MDHQKLDFAAFNKIAFFFYALVGISFEAKPKFIWKCVYGTLCFCTFLFSMQLYGFLVEGKGTEDEISFVVTMASYFNVTMGKLIFMMYKRASLVKSYEQFKEVYPNLKEILTYNLEHYPISYGRLARFMSTCIVSISSIYLIIPLVQATWMWFSVGEFQLKLQMPLWFPGEFTYGIFIYIIWYLQVIFACYSVGATVTCSNLYLIGSISQLCLHFDMLSQRILEIHPSELGSLDQLKSIVKQHQNIIKICDSLNKVFSPIVVLSAFFSSAIMCFALYGVLEETSFIKICMAFLLVCYELKETALICYFGNRLIDNSALIFDALYNHDWMDGSLEYRRQVLFMMMNTLRPKELRMPGVPSISLLTFKEVLSISYELFAVFKNT